MSLIPSDASRPGAQNDTLLLCLAPISGEKCALLGKSLGWVAALQFGRKVTV
jgi:hypothetical protein